MSGETGVRELGVPVKSVNWVRLFAGQDAAGGPCLYATMGQQAAPMFVARIDIRTGHCEQFAAPVEGAHYPTASFWSERRRCLFVGAHPGGCLMRLDAGGDRLENLGPIHAGAADFPCRIDEAPDGALYIGSYGACDLTRYDPEAGEFTRFGRMDEVDQYFYPLCGADGTVAGLVRVTRPHVVALDPATGGHTIVGPVADTDARQGHVELLKGSDGLLYIRSHEGSFRVRGMAIEPVEGVPDPMPERTLPDGSTFRMVNEGPQLFLDRQIEITSRAGDKRTIELDWEGAGTQLFVVRGGPDGKVYGSSVLPLHFFSHDPATGELADHGACSTSGGELYSIGHMDGLLYTCAYPAAKLSVYDPSRPYRFGTDQDANPRELGRMDEVAYRPRDMLCGPAGKVWVASIPDYGMWGGTLAWYDPPSGQFGSHRHIIRDCSPVALAHVPERSLIAVGFSIAAGSGCTPRAERAGFALWDPHKDVEVWQGDLGLAVEGVMDLCEAGEGLTYAIVHQSPEELHAELMLLDLPGGRIVGRTVMDQASIGWPLEVSFQPGDRYIVGATGLGVYRVERGSVEIEMLRVFEDGDGPTCGGALLGGRYYFGTRHRLRVVPAGPQRTRLSDNPTRLG